jgi:hypothetical protein
MRKTYSAFLGGFLLPLVSAMSAELVAGDFGQPRIVVPAPENPRFAHLAWPKIVKANDGALVLAYSAGRFHGNGGEGCPAVSISTDEGQTFTSPKILREFDQTTRYDNSANSALGVAEDGAVVLLAMAYTGNERNSIFGWRSPDSGQTWEPVDTSNLAEGKTGSVFGHVFPVPGKGLAVAGHFRPGSTGRTDGIWMAYSSDHGRTWGPPQLVTEKKLFEPAIVFAKSRLVGLFREPGKANYYWQGVSDDQCTKWTWLRRCADPTASCQLPSPFLTVSPQDPSLLYALVSRRHVPRNLPGRIVLWKGNTRTLDRLPTDLREKPGETRTVDWTRHGLVVEFPEALGKRNDITYPWMTHLDGDDWFLVFYCGQPHGPSALYGMTLTISE